MMLRSLVVFHAIFLAATSAQLCKFYSPWSYSDCQAHSSNIGLSKCYLSIPENQTKKYSPFTIPTTPAPMPNIITSNNGPKPIKSESFSKTSTIQSTNVLSLSPILGFSSDTARDWKRRAAMGLARVTAFGLARVFDMDPLTKVLTPTPVGATPTMKPAITTAMLASTAAAKSVSRTPAMTPSTVASSYSKLSEPMTPPILVASTPAPLSVHIAPLNVISSQPATVATAAAAFLSTPFIAPSFQSVATAEALQKNTFSVEFSPSPSSVLSTPSIMCSSSEPTLVTTTSSKGSTTPSMTRTIGPSRILYKVSFTKSKIQPTSVAAPLTTLSVSRIKEYATQQKMSEVERIIPLISNSNNFSHSTYGYRSWRTTPSLHTSLEINRSVEVTENLKRSSWRPVLLLDHLSSEYQTTTTASTSTATGAVKAARTATTTSFGARQYL